MSQQPGGLTHAVAEAKRLWQQRHPGLVKDSTQVFHSAEEVLSSDYARQHPFSEKEIAAMHSAEGFYDPRTGQTVIIAGNVGLRPGETPQGALTRVMLHEHVGHDGLGLLLTRRGTGPASRTSTANAGTTCRSTFRRTCWRPSPTSRGMST